jgi:hypothetical protein
MLVWHIRSQLKLFLVSGRIDEVVGFRELSPTRNESYHIHVTRFLQDGTNW